MDTSGSQIEALTFYNLHHRLRYSCSRLDLIFLFIATQQVLKMATRQMTRCQQLVTKVRLLDTI